MGLPSPEEVDGWLGLQSKRRKTSGWGRGILQLMCCRSLGSWSQHQGYQKICGSLGRRPASCCPPNNPPPMQWSVSSWRILSKQLSLGGFQMRQHLLHWWSSLTDWLTDSSKLEIGNFACLTVLAPKYSIGWECSSSQAGQSGLPNLSCPSGPSGHPGWTGHFA